MKISLECGGVPLFVGDVRIAHAPKTITRRGRVFNLHAIDGTGEPVHHYLEVMPWELEQADVVSVERGTLHEVQAERAPDPHALTLAQSIAFQQIVAEKIVGLQERIVTLLEHALPEGAEGFAKIRGARVSLSDFDPPAEVHQPNAPVDEPAAPGFGPHPSDYDGGDAPGFYEHGGTRGSS